MAAAVRRSADQANEREAMAANTNHVVLRIG
jgi:hypothetical protein